MAYPILMGPEFSVNTTTAGDQTFAVVASFTDGRFVAVWEDRQTAGIELRGQIFDAGGFKIAGEFSVNTTTADIQARPNIAVLSDNRFVVTWEDLSGVDSEAGAGIRARVFESDGAAIGNDFLVNATRGGDQYSSSVSALSIGGFVVTYTDGSSDDGDIRSRVYGADLQPLGNADILVGTNPVEVHVDSTVIGLNQGYAVIFTDIDAVTLQYSLRARIFDAAGNPTVAEFAVSSFAAGDAGIPNATMLADGRFVVVWTQFEGAVQTIRGRIYSPNGTPAGAEIAVNATTLGILKVGDRVGVSALADGGFAVTYTDSKTATKWDIHATMFDSSGARIGSDAIISPQNVNGDKSLPSLATLADGRLIATWLDESGLPSDPVGISGQILDPRTTAVSLIGTGANDKYIGTSFADTMNGAAGHDSIDGANGNDFLTGAAGNDTLIGGAGNDTLDGGVGKDELEGGAGDDTYILSAMTAEDTIVENFNGGFDTAVVGADTVLDVVSAIEALTAAPGTTPIALDGNSDANRLTGNDGANRLDGQRGADTLIGGGGDDTFIVDSARDLVTDSSGFDTVETEASYALAAGSGIEVLKTSDSANFDTISLTGDSGANTVRGNAGISVLSGMGGDDMLYGKAGNDVLSGGVGRDIFVFDTKPRTSTNRDKIVDFKPVDDSIYLDHAVFKKVGKGSVLAPGKLNKAFFKVGEKARDKNDYVGYDPKKGVFWYDADGSGSGAAIQVAALTKKLKMSYLDILVI